jgi:arabinogalactan oligomer/maltooligosaccharide transport system permease protein
MSMTQKNKKKALAITKKISLHTFFIIFCFITMIPILYALSVSFNASNSLLSSDFSFLPKAFTLANYKAVFMEESVLLWFKNSVILAVCTVTIALGVSIPAAYAFSRMRFQGRRPLLNMLILLNAFPSLLSMFAIYKLMNPLGLINTRIGLIIVYTGTMAVFGLWNMKGYFDTIPYDIEEAARIDGANELQIVWRIVLPLAKPSIVVTAVMVLIYVWNEYIYAITFLTGADKYTLAAGLYSLQAGEMSGSWPVFAAASLVISLPVLLIFLYVQKHMVSGLTAGGVKG